MKNHEDMVVQIANGCHGTSRTFARTAEQTCEVKQMADYIKREDAIRIASGYCHPANVAKELAKLPSAQSEQKSRLAREIEGLTPEETYDFLDWLLHGYGLQYTDSRQAVIEWLRGEQDG